LGIGEMNKEKGPGDRALQNGGHPTGQEKGKKKMGRGKKKGGGKGEFETRPFPVETTFQVIQQTQGPKGAKTLENRREKEKENTCRGGVFASKKNL